MRTALLIPLLLLLAMPAASGAQEVSPGVREVAVLPEERWEAAGASDGKHLYLFGGSARSEGPVDASTQILRYDPRTETLETRNATLPTGVDFATAVWTGRVFLVMGGVHRTVSANEELDDVVEYDPAADVATPARGQLAVPVYASAGVFFQGRAYLFGGFCVREGIQTVCDTILSYDPETGASEIIEARLQEPLSTPGVATDGESVYVFGGANTKHGGHNDIRQWRPDFGGPVVLADTLPSSQHGPVVAWDGNDFLVAGGGAYRPLCGDGVRWCAPVLRFSMSQGVRRTDVLSPPTVEESNVGAWLDGRLVVATSRAVYEVDPDARGIREHELGVPGVPPILAVALAAVALAGRRTFLKKRPIARR